MFANTVSSALGAGCLVISGQRYKNTDLNIGISAAANVDIKLQLLNETPTSILASVVTASSIHHIDQNFQVVYVSWTANTGTVSITTRQYELLGD